MEAKGCALLDTPEFWDIVLVVAGDEVSNRESKEDSYKSIDFPIYLVPLPSVDIVDGVADLLKVFR